ncbi:hypothetical protein F5X99DRAFT_411308 [Biscogniauxia marginata]|nr:hypothetical protein F5X99DRAFT_411308 [Biscogniauxia marginata]
MTDSPGHGTSSSSARPSFTDYWKRSKDETTVKNITFIQSNLQQEQVRDEDDEQAEMTAQHKAQLRRSQVRKAQIQHRQRKANYTKKLEMDISKLREQIEETENDCVVLRNENEVIRQRLSHSSSFHHAASNLPQTTTRMAMASSLCPPEYTVSLSMSDIMNTPAFQITRTQSPSSEASYTRLAAPGEDFLAAATSASSAYAAAATSSGVSMPAEPAALELPGDFLLSGVETDEAINFILALEHICWNHFDASYFTHEEDHGGETVAAAATTANEHGHALMASAIALQDAPREVFAQIDGMEERLRSSSTRHHRHEHYHHDDPTFPVPSSRDAACSISWRTSGLTLQKLHGLASALNPPDREIAPVQAWFEIARAYGADAARDAALLRGVARELAGVVKCLHFGAVIERGAFESVLGRVYGPPVVVVVVVS